MVDYGAELASRFLETNAGLVPAGGGARAGLPPAGVGPSSMPAPHLGDEVHTRIGDNKITRIADAGGAVTNLFLHPSFLPIENLFRKLAEQAMFTATPENPFKFELGALAVPANQALLVTDFRFRPFRLSGAAAGDTMPLEEERMSTLFAFDFTISNSRKAALRMEIDPTAIEATKEAYIALPNGGTIFPSTRAGATALAPATSLQFNLAALAQSVVPAGAGLAALPNRPHRIGGDLMPFTMLATENQRVQGTCTIFRPIPQPIAFFELDVTGFIMSMNTMRAMMETVKPADEAEVRRLR